MLKILLICRAIAPVQSIAAVRWTKIAKYLKKNHDVHITVLTDEKDLSGDPQALNAWRIDPLLEKDTQFFDAYWVASNTPIVKLFYYLKKRKVKNQTVGMGALQEASHQEKTALVKKEMRAFLQDKKELLFYDSVMRFLKTQTLDFDVVISSFSPIWTHLVARKIKQQHPEVFWVADFRDPYASDNAPPWAFARRSRFVSKHCEEADLITRVTNDMYLNAPRNKVIKCLTNGYDPAEALPAQRPNEFTVVYTGVLYGARRDIGVVCKALKELIDEKKVQDAKVLYAGPDGALALELANKYGAESVIRDLGTLPRDDALKLQQQAAVLLQMNWNTKHEHCEWSGKMFEYMMMCKPILFVVTGIEPYSYPSQHMEKLGGVCYEQCRHDETYPLMKQYILEKYQEWMQTGNVTIQRDETYVEQYSYENIAEQAWNLICKKQKEV